MTGFAIALVLGYLGKWRWLGYVVLFDLLVTGTAGLYRGGSDRMLALVLVMPFAGVALGYGAGAAWHRLRHGAWPHDLSAQALRPVEVASAPDGQPVLSWETEGPIMTAPVVRAFAIAFAVVAGLLFTVFAIVSGGRIATALALAGIGLAGLAGLCLVAVYGLLFNRLRRFYVLTPEGYATIVTDPRVLAGSAAAAGTGIATGNATTAGVGMAAASSLDARQAWVDADSIVIDERRHTIRVGLGWRGHDVILCPPQTCIQIRQWIAANVPGPAVNDA